MSRRDTTHDIRQVFAAPNASPGVRRACAAFGLAPNPARTHCFTPEPAAIDQRLIARVAASDTVLLTGPSGTGKTTMLRAIKRTLRSLAVVVTQVDASALENEHHASLDVVSPRMSVALRALSAAGLAEPELWARPAYTLSVGERARLALAIAMVRTPRGGVVVCDEFATPLDRASAESLAGTARRWCVASGVTLLAATAHEDMPSLLAPDLLIDAGTGMQVSCPGPVRSTFRFEPGSFQDYLSLARYHYRPGHPAVRAGILRAIRTTPAGEEVLAGALVVAHPTLNAIWRRYAWPGRYDEGDKRQRQRRLNDEVRCVARVIVEPRSRGMGVATALVRAYLSHPLTAATEALAAMGSVCPFFSRAGMTEYRVPRPYHDSRLLDALASAGHQPDELLDSVVFDSALIRSELVRWARASRIATDHTDPLPQLGRHAACRLLSSPRAFAFTRTGGSDEEKDRQSDSYAGARAGASAA